MLFNPGLPVHAETLDPLLVLLLAMAIDVVAGDPAWLYRRVPHPVEILGRLIALVEARWNRPLLSDEARARLGATSAMTVTAGAFALGWGVAYGLRELPQGWVIEAALASNLIAFRSLDDRVRAIAAALPASLEAGREAVSHIVGRDPDTLDAHGVARAAIESLAENFSDGVVAPVFWYVVLGLPGLLAYKAINTMDSMIGYRTPRHEAFGRAAARADDVANWVPARMAGRLIALAAYALPAFDGKRAFQVMFKDARQHASPNAGWPEAAMAGALDVALAGPRSYDGISRDDAWIGGGRRDATASDIRGALTLYRAAGVTLALSVIALLLVK
jgi:adenosylcobinamide-phosphate synthase